MNGIALGIAVLLGAVGGWPAAVALGVAVTVGVGVAGDRRFLLPGLVVVGACVGGAWRREPPPTGAPIPWVDAASAVRGRVIDTPVATGRSQRAVLTVSEARGPAGWNAADGVVCAIGPRFPTLGEGDQVVASGATVPIDDLSPRLRGFLGAHGCGASSMAYDLKIETVGSGWRRQAGDLSRRISGVLQDGATGDVGVLLSGLVTGDDHAFSNRRRDAFLETGTTHLTAVSGANVALLVTIAATLGSVAGWRRRVAWQAVTVVVVWGYAGLTGAEPPVVRAALVATGALLASRCGRRADCVTLVVLAAAAMVVVEPGQLWRLSYQLSVASSLALAAVLPAFAPAGFLGWVRALMVASAAAQIVTLPLLLPLDGTVSLLSLPTNVLVAPLVNVAFPIAALGAAMGLLWAPIGEALLLPAQVAAEGVIGVVDAAATTADTAPIGAVSGHLLVLLTTLAAASIVAISSEGRAWVRRLAAASRRLPPETRAVVMGGAAGVLAVALVLRWTL